MSQIVSLSDSSFLRPRIRNCVLHGPQSGDFLLYLWQKGHFAAYSFFIFTYLQIAFCIVLTLQLLQLYRFVSGTYSRVHLLLCLLYALRIAFLPTFIADKRQAEVLLSTVIGLLLFIFRNFRTVTLDRHSCCHQTLKIVWILERHIELALRVLQKPIGLHLPSEKVFPWLDRTLALVIVQLFFEKMPIMRVQT